MPLVKRTIQPRHLCHGAVPDGIGTELECVTNNTLSAIIRQLSSLSKHAENVFGELFNEANTFYVRANSLQDRIDRLALKVTQLDSSVEEVSLQDINMRKAFKGSTVQNQQVVAKSSNPNAVSEMYNTCDKAPPLGALTAYREDNIDAMKFYTDPQYFFELWKEKMLQDTEEKRRERRRLREQKRCVDSTLQREVKKVRKARNRRHEWNMMAFDKELRPDHRHPHSLRRGASSEGSLSPDGRPDLPDFPPVPPGYVSGGNAGPPSSPLAEHEYQIIGATYRSGTPACPSTTPPPPPHNGPPLPPVHYNPMEYAVSSGPTIPSAQTAFGSPQGGGLPPPTAPLYVSQGGYSSLSSSSLPPIPPPPGPPPPPVPSSAAHPHHHHHHHHHPGHGETTRMDPQPVVKDARSDLLSAIRMGIQLKKVQEQQNQQEPMGNDVATILSRRIAVEYSDSDDDSELDDHDWSD